MIKLLINQPILLASLVIGSLLFVAALIYLLVLLRRRRSLNIAPKPARPVRTASTPTTAPAPTPEPVATTVPDTATQLDEAQAMPIEMPAQPSGEIALPVLGAPETEAASLASGEAEKIDAASDALADNAAQTASEKPKPAAKFTLFRRKKKTKAPAQKQEMAEAAKQDEKAAEKAAPSESDAKLSEAGIVAAAPHQSDSEKRLSHRLMSIEQEMLALKELYQDGQITRHVYVNETRHLYDEAEKLVQIN